MANSNVNLATPTGNADTFTAPDGDHRQVIVVGDPATADAAKVNAQGGMSIAGASYTPTATTVAAATTGTLGPVDVSGAGNVTFWIANSGTAFTGSPVINLEQSYDNTNWAPLQGVRSDNSAIVSTFIMNTLAANTALAIDCACEGVAYVRIRVSTGTATGTIALAALPGGGFFEPIVSTVERSEANRVQIAITGSATLGTSGTEAILNLTQGRGLAATSASTTYAITPGKTLRIQYLRFQHVANAAVTATVNWKIRANPSGAAIVTSTPILMTVVTRTPPTSGTVGTADLALGAYGFDVPCPIGGNVNLGITVLPTWGTTAPSYDFTLVGYEY